MKIKNSVECWICNRETGRILLLQCPETHRHKKYWQPVTGGIESDESASEACLREVFEETGLRFIESDLDQIFEKVVFLIPEEDMELVRSVFMVYTEKSEIVLSSEHLAYKWELSENVNKELLWNSNKETFRKIKDIL